MTVFTNQSDISEVRDQMSLDFADGKYLNVVAANLGLHRPPFGFSDDTWRALVKEVALQYKQIRTKFEEILTIILGPKVTQVGAFAQAVLVGDKTAVLVRTDQFPQVGTMVIDEGLATQETLVYTYIDRYTNTVYFKTPAAFAHAAINAEWESGIINTVVATEQHYVVFDSTGFPNPAVPYPVLVGRGTPYEYVDVISAVDAAPSRRIAVVTGSPAGSPGVTTSSGITTALTALATQENVYYLSMLDISELAPTRGHLQGQLTGSLTATAGTVKRVDITGPITASAYCGFFIVFNGNVTAAIKGKVAYVEDNTTTRFNFQNSLPAAPVAGDTFTLLTNIEYLRADVTDNSVLMKKELPDLRKFAISTQFTVTEPVVTAAVAQVQVKHVDWEVFQSDPRNVEILLPNSFLVNDLRTASYLHETGLSGSTSADAIRNIGDLDISVATTDTFPLFGTVLHQLVTEYTYYIPHAYTQVEALAGDVVLHVNDTSLFTGATLRVGGAIVAYTVTDATTLAVGALPAYVPRGTLAQDEHILRLIDPLTVPIGVIDAIDYAPANTAPVDTGDMWTTPGTWAGPYLWDLFGQVLKQETSPGTVIDNAGPNIAMVSGPVRSEVDRLFGATVFEIEDASAFPTAHPFTVKIGENSGNLETLSVEATALKERAHTDLSVAGTPGDTFLRVTALAGTGSRATFPNGGPYRVLLLSTPASNNEVVEVIGTSSGPNKLLLSPATPLINAHNVGDLVELFSDLILVSPGAADDHLGSVKAADRLSYYAPVSQYADADLVRPVYSTLPLTAGVDFPVTAGKGVFNFGDKQYPVRARLSINTVGTTLTFADSSVFPSANFPYVLYVDVGAGPLYEEKVFVTVNNTGTQELTIDHAFRFGPHLAGVWCEYRPGPSENFEYTSRTGNVLDFLTGLEVEHTHYRPEFVAPTVGDNYPRRNGYDFPLRIPVTIEDRILFMVNLVRAAGVNVSFIRRR